MGVEEAYRWHDPHFMNQMYRRVWANANGDLSRRIRQRLESVLRARLTTEGYGEFVVRIDVGQIPPQWHRVRFGSSSLEHVRYDVQLRWEGGCTIEITMLAGERTRGSRVSCCRPRSQPGVLPPNTRIIPGWIPRMLDEIPLSAAQIPRMLDEIPPAPSRSRS